MKNFTIGKAFGIPIRLDLTFLLILPIFAWIIGDQVGVWVNQLNMIWGANLDPKPLTEGMMPWILGIVAAVGLFVGVILHELGHSLVAMEYGYPIESITLWLLGGISQLKDQPSDWKQELYIAIAGPLVSFILGALAYGGFRLVGSGLPTIKFLLGYLALMNIVLGAFNLLPGFPMDGGRVLRALLARTRPFERATQIAAEVGKGFALLLGLLGILIPNLILIALAFFIFIGASGEAQRTVMNAAFQDVSVRDIMTEADEVKTVSPDLTVAELMERMFRERHTGYPVVKNGEIIGMVTLEDAQQVKEVEREAYEVEEIMTTELTSIEPDDNAMDAFEKMQENNIGRLVVTDDGELIGLISRTDIMTALDIIQSSGQTSQSLSRSPTS
ncbi:MAG: CBS domain-containing protein [Halobacteriaceae archaeon]